MFDAILEKALRLCGAAFGMINTYDGDRFHHAADHGVPPVYAEYRRNNPMTFAAGTGPARIIAGEDVIYNVDLKAEEAYARGDPNRRALVDLGGGRSHLAVALRKESRLLFARERQQNQEQLPCVKFFRRERRHVALEHRAHGRRFRKVFG